MILDSLFCELRRRPWIIPSTNHVPQSSNLSRQHLRMVKLSPSSIVYSLLTRCIRGIFLEFHLPNLVARQLGFCQAIHAPFSEKTKKHFINGHAKDPKKYNHIFHKNKRRRSKEIQSDRTQRRKGGEYEINSFDHYEPLYETNLGERLFLTLNQNLTRQRVRNH